MAGHSHPHPAYGAHGTHAGHHDHGDHHRHEAGHEGHAAHHQAHAHGQAAGHQHDLKPFRHSHAFGSEGEEARGRALLAVTVVTIVMMVAELAAGWWSGSLALTADGWHMGTHAAALGGAVLAMRWSRRARDHEGFAFGGWKIEVLAAYTSALMLAAVAIGLAIDAVQTLLNPRPIAFGEAIGVALLGLAVNLLSVWLLARSGHEHSHGPGGHAHGHAHGHSHGHSHGHAHGAAHAQSQAHTHAGSHAHRDHDHGHDHKHQPANAAKKAHHDDHNFRAAYVHVLADAFTSVLAIAALTAGLLWGWTWADPVVALVGAAVIGQWSWGLLRSTARALVDASAEAPLRDAVRAAIESDGDAKLADLHVWQVGPQAYSGVLSIVADEPLAPAAYQHRLQPISALKHTTIEVHRCTNC